MCKIVFRTVLVYLVLLLMSSFTNQTELEKILQEWKEVENSDDDLTKSDILNRLGYAFWGEHLYKDAINSFEKSVSINIQLGNDNALMNLYTNLGMLYSELNEFETALVNHKKSQDVRARINENPMKCQGLINMARTCQMLKRYNNSDTYALSALELAKEMDDNKLIKACYGILYENASNLGIASKAHEYFEYYSAFDKALKEERIEKVQKEALLSVAEKQKEVDKEKEEKVRILEQKEETETKLVETEQVLVVTEAEKQKSIEDLQRTQHELELKAQLINQQRKIQSLFVAGLFFLGLLLLFVYRNFRIKKRANAMLEAQKNEIQRQSDLIEKKNSAITESITYAQHIQESMLFSEEKFNAYLSESFILYRAKEIVSGDFYWFNYENFSSFLKPLYQKETITEDNLIIAAVDCTGHGVPGGFMSMIGYNLLDEIVSNGINKPHHILDSLHFGVKHSLKQWDTDNTDGMDVALCKINFKQNRIEFAGANNPLIIVRNGELVELKGTRFPIGGQEFKKRSPFASQSYDFDTEISCYLFSDGYADQFGGSRNKKIGSSRFYQLLLEHYKKPMKEQKQILERYFDEWKADYKQIDDVLVMGFKLFPFKQN